MANCNYNNYYDIEDYAFSFGGCPRRYPLPPPQPLPPRPCCCEGPPGPPGRSAYQIALAHGFVGTEAQWLESLKGTPGPFLSSYFEAVGSTQTVETDSNFVFNRNPDALDIVGNAFAIDATGTIITIVRPGLYHVEWSFNIFSATSPIIAGLLEQGQASSALYNSSTAGNHSSGGLINVTALDLPYTVSLHNFGAPLALSDVDTALSIRIARIADGPAV